MSDAVPMDVVVVTKKSRLNSGKAAPTEIMDQPFQVGSDEEALSTGSRLTPLSSPSSKSGDGRTDYQAEMTRQSDNFTYLSVVFENKAPPSTWEAKDGCLLFMGAALAVRLATHYGLSVQVSDKKTTSSLTGKHSSVNLLFDSTLFGALDVTVARLVVPGEKDPDGLTTVTSLRTLQSFYTAVPWYSRVPCEVDYEKPLIEQDPCKVSLPYYFFTPEIDVFAQLSYTERKSVSDYSKYYSKDGLEIFSWMREVIKNCGDTL